jgi:hypothetical protein
LPVVKVRVQRPAGGAGSANIQTDAHEHLMFLAQGGTRHHGLMANLNHYR